MTTFTTSPLVTISLILLPSLWYTLDCADINNNFRTEQSEYLPSLFDRERTRDTNKHQNPVNLEELLCPMCAKNRKTESEHLQNILNFMSRDVQVAEKQINNLLPYQHVQSYEEKNGKFLFLFSCLIIL